MNAKFLMAVIEAHAPAKVTAEVRAICAREDQMKRAIQDMRHEIKVRQQTLLNTCFEEVSHNGSQRPVKCYEPLA